MSLIVFFQHDGVMRRLSRPADWRDLASSRAMTRDSILSIRREDGVTVETRADDVPELRAVFDALDPPKHRDVSAFARRDATVAGRPAADAEAIAALGRGDAVTVRLDGPLMDLPADGWVTVRTGEDLGYVPAEVLARTPPPPLLDRDGRHELATLTRAAVLTAGVQPDSPTLRELEPGTTVVQLGRIDGDRFEVLDEVGTIGYLDARAFEPSSETPVPERTPPEPAHPLGATGAASTVPHAAVQESKPEGAASTKPSDGARPKRKASRYVRGFLVLGALAAALIVAVSVLGGQQAQAPSIATGTRWYAVRNVNIRTAPSKDDGALLGQLRRGESIEAVVDDTGPSLGTYVRIVRPPYEGAYVWRRNLSPESRPALTGAARSLTPSAPTVLRLEPRDDAAEVETVDAGQTLSVVGDAPGGWLEVSLRRGGVGYLQPQLGGPAVAPAPSPTATAASSPTDAVAGSAYLLDSGVIVVGGRSLRLHGMSGLPRADFVAQANQFLSSADPITCAPLGDAWQCLNADGRDVAQVLVFSGFARATGLAYAADEADARSERVGLWAGS